MFCPVCRSEYRPGFTRCADCEVDLVERLEDAPSSRPREPGGMAGPLVDYCGFLDLEEARQVRATLRQHGIASEVVLRDTPGGEGEEYWLRVPAAAARRVAELLGDLPEPQAEGPAAAGRRACPSCGEPAGAGESFCARCGSRFA